MSTILGIILVLGSCAAGFVLSHGNLLSLWQPFELLIIGGSAFGAFVMSNPIKLTIKVLKSLPNLLKGSKYNKKSYIDLLGLMYEIFAKARKNGVMSLEADVDEPKASPLFKKYPAIVKDHHVVEFITDYLRLVIGGNMNSFEIEALMELELETHHDEAGQAPHALTKVADALPGFGIVAAVMGVVITMSSLGGPVEEIGAHVAAALVGTFLGILLAYGFVGPMGNYLEHQVREEAKYYECIKTCIMAMINGYAPQIAVEFGRKVLYSNERPGFNELEGHIRKMKA